MVLCNFYIIDNLTIKNFIFKHNRNLCLLASSLKLSSLQVIAQAKPSDNLFLYIIITIYKMQKVSMFSRNFMQEFPIRKYADITAKTGSMSTDNWIRNNIELRIRKPIYYLSMGAFIVAMFINFHSVDEMVGPIPRPAAFTIYEKGVLKEVLYPNLEVIAGWQAINEMQELKQTFEYDS